eukprot:CAMPEP_0206509586 /NCGR_PEP_ID=MMETSP0324_2-20121206/59024_1 /ASSEMBLY_ACC=CAM_ASM_000836 /TAXON_ID=2866 /ORGANISM="Crypthecodinium cohnii, Strain Seligo" /LENGTH=975 /DNA_ID=CAMNT_0054000685 /DNA_START=154 /DNA_END=3078 /DNA_ORIENTATION=-
MSSFLLRMGSFLFSEDDDRSPTKGGYAVEHREGSLSHLHVDKKRHLQEFGPIFFSNSFQARIRHRLLIALGSTAARRVVLSLVCIYVILAVVAILIDFGVVCINPKDVHASLKDLQPVDNPTRLRGYGEGWIDEHDNMTWETLGNPDGNHSEQLPDVFGGASLLQNISVGHHRAHQPQVLASEQTTSVVSDFNHAHLGRNRRAAATQQLQQQQRHGVGVAPSLRGHRRAQLAQTLAADGVDRPRGQSKPHRSHNTLTRILVCEPPYVGGALIVIRTIGNTCLILSISMILEHLLRAYAMTWGYFSRFKMLHVDFWVTLSAAFTDSVLVFVFRPMVVEATMQHKRADFALAMMLVCRICRLMLLWRVFRAVNSQLDSGGEVLWTFEAMEAIGDPDNGMPRVKIHNVHIVKSTSLERSAYKARLGSMKHTSGSVIERLLWCGTSGKSPENVIRSGRSLDHHISEDPRLPKCLACAQRPVYVDSCYAYTDWTDDPSGKVRQMLVVKALVGNSRQVGEEEFSEARPRSPGQGVNAIILRQNSISGSHPGEHAVYDSVHTTPIKPFEYKPQQFSLPQRDVESTIYAFHEPVGQVIPMAIITYENPDAYKEIDVLREAEAQSWPDLYDLALSGPRHTPAQVAALAELDRAIDGGVPEQVQGALDRCSRAKVRKAALADLKLKKRSESEEAGISLAYLLSDAFRRLAQERTGKDDPTFSEMKDPFFVDEVPGRPRIGASSLCPRDLGMGCSFVDSVEPKFRGPANVFLSWVWSYRLSVVCDGLQRWALLSDRDPERVFLFICFFCNNQSRILREQTAFGSDTLQNLFERRLVKIGCMVALMDSWDSPVYIQRIWTIYEQFVATHLGIAVEFILPAEPAATLITELEKGKDGINNVISTVSKVDAEHAKATFEEDEQQVKRLISKSIGFRSVNKAVKTRIITWIAEEFKSSIDRLVQEPQGDMGMTPTVHAPLVFESLSNPPC